MNLGMESEILEFKKSTSELKEGVISLSSMLNKHGEGTLYFGVKNDGTVIGQNDSTPSTLRDISRKIAEGIKPQVIPEISLLLIDDKNVIKVTVKGNANIYSAFDKYYIRSFDEDKKISPDMLRELINSKGEPDLITNESAIRTDLTFETLKGLYLIKGRKINIEQFEKNLKFYTNDGKFNYMAELLSDVNDISIKVVTFAGIDKTVMVKRTEYGMKCLISAVNEVLEYMSIINETKVKLGGKKRIEASYFDYACFKEAWLNACVHTRWIEKIPPAVYIYDDRIEIVSNGGLPKSLNKTDFFMGVSKPVNHALLNIFANLDLIDQTGHGVPLIIKKYGEEAFYISDNTIIVTIPINKELLETIDNKNDSFDLSELKNNENVYSELSDTELKVYNCIKENNTITMSELSNKIDVSDRQIKRIVKKLKDNGFIIREGSNKTGIWKVIKNI